MKLWVDDIRPAPEGWVWARTVTEAIRLLATQPPYDHISLDHDISHEITLNTGLSRPYPCGETFEPVARFLGVLWWYINEVRDAEDGDGWNPKITLHTANPVGAEKMEAILGDYGVACEVKPMGPASRSK